MQDGALTNRYEITHKDGQPVDPAKRFFVLDLSSPDLRERAAFEAFIFASEQTGYETLAADLRAALDAAPGGEDLCLATLCVRLTHNDEKPGEPTDMLGIAMHPPVSATEIAPVADELVDTV